MKRQILILTMILAALLLAVLMATNVDDSARKSGSKARLFDFTREEIQAFEIDNFTQGLYFKKEGEDWTVKLVETELGKAVSEKDGEVTTGKVDAKAPAVKAEAVPVRADPVKVSSLLTSLIALKAGQPIATEKDSIGKFQINAHSLNIRLYGNDGNEIGRLYVGKNGPDFMSSFVKKADKDAVYLVDENMQGFLGYPYEQWVIEENKNTPKATTETTKKGATHAGSKNKKRR